MANIIITNISKLKENAANRLYSSDCGEIDGMNTNDAPVKYLMKLLTDKNQPITEIIAVTTAEAEPALEVFEKTLSDYAKETGIKKPEIKPINASEESFAQTIKDITAGFASGDKAYIDTTGGFRNSSYILMCVVRILEYSGIRLEKAVYSNLEKKCITDVTDIYRKYDLINAVDAFTNFGNSYGLEQYFKDTQEPAVKAVISAMNKFSDMISLCRTSELSSILEELNESLLQLSVTHSDSTDIILFQSLIGTIREKFYMKNNSIEYPDIVRWCLDNKLIQQAVTIYVERMPEYFFKKEIIICGVREILDVSHFNKNFDEYYNLLYNGFLKQSTSKTLSPYPFSNLILGLKKSKKNIYKEVCETTNINELSIKDSLTQDERSGILNLIKVKNAMYENNKRRGNEAIEKRKLNNKLAQFRDSGIFSIEAKNTEGFVNEVFKNDEFLKLLQGEYAHCKPKVWKMADLNVIEHIDLVLSENKNQYRIEKSKVDGVKSILKDVVYIKRYIRNAMNHASEESCISDEYDDYFFTHGFKIKEDLTVSEIREFMINAIEKLKF